MKWAIKALLGPEIVQKFKRELGLGENLDHHFLVKFHVETNGDGLDALKRSLDPVMGHKGLNGAKKQKFKI